MSHFFKSATQFVLVFQSIVLSCVITYMVIMNPHDRDIALTLMALFANTVVSAYSFYFGQKTLPTGGTIDTQVTTLKNPNSDTVTSE